MLGNDGGHVGFMRNQIVPPSFLFQYSMAIPHVAAIPYRKGKLLRLADSSRLFVPGVMNEASAPFDLKVAWNAEGLGIEIGVSGKKLAPAGRLGNLKTSDHISLFVDTRHTASVHRATEYCSSLKVLPCDEDADNQPSVSFAEIAQQRSVKKDLNGRKCEVRCHVCSDGYNVELWIPGTQLFGFDEAPEIGRIGFCCMVHDTELGEMPLSVGDDFPVAFDPSTWLQMELAS